MFFVVFCRNKGGETELDMHPEKRMKAAFRAYEEQRLPILKAENPNMRLSQIKQMLKKDWMKAEENPMVQFTMAKSQRKTWDLSSAICRLAL